MKKLALISSLAIFSTGAFAQGLVNFFNNPSTLISSEPGVAIPAGAANSYYFALLTAPLGTLDPTAFTFSGISGGNQATAGRFFGGNGLVVAGWAPGTSRSFMVAGWSASLGTTWKPEWLSGIGSVIGVSAIGSGAAGGFDGIGTLPNLNVFGAAPSITSGFIVPVPEPTSMALAGLGAAAMLIFRRRK